MYCALPVKTTGESLHVWPKKQKRSEERRSEKKRNRKHRYGISKIERSDDSIASFVVGELIKGIN